MVRLFSNLGEQETIQIVKVIFWSGITHVSEEKEASNPTFMIACTFPCCNKSHNDYRRKNQWAADVGKRKGHKSALKLASRPVRRASVVEQV